MSILVRIHHNHGCYGWLIEKLGKWSTWREIPMNSFCVLRVADHDLIPWCFMRSFLVELNKYFMVARALALIPDDHHKINWSCY